MAMKVVLRNRRPRNYFFRIRKIITDNKYHNTVFMLGRPLIIKYELKSFLYVELYYDNETQEIGLKFHNDERDNSYKLTYMSNAVQLSLGGLIRTFELNPDDLVGIYQEESVTKKDDMIMLNTNIKSTGEIGENSNE